MMRHSEILKLFACNVQGSGTADKIAQLRARSVGADFVVLNECNKSPGDESTVDLRLQASVISNTPASGLGTGFGTYGGMKIFDPDKGDSIEIDDHFELVVMKKVTTSGAVISVIGNYRSPNMSPDELLRFYTTVEKYVKASIDNGSDIGPVR